MISYFGLDHDRPTIRLFNQYIWAPTFLENSPDLLRENIPILTQVLKNFTKGCINRLFVGLSGHVLEDTFETTIFGIQ